MRCDPQPGHFNPVITKNGHFGKKSDPSGLKLEYSHIVIAITITNMAIIMDLCFTKKQKVN